MPQIGDSITFFGMFTASGSGAAGLTVTAAAKKPDGSALTIGAVSDLGDGLYSAVAAGANVDAAGYYRCMFTTAGTADVDDIPAVEYVSAAVITVADILDHVITAPDHETDGSVAKYLKDIDGSVTNIYNTVNNIYSAITGPGATQYFFKVLNEATTPLDHVKVWFTNTDDPTAVVAGLYLTDTDGYVNGANGVYLDAGNTYYMWANTSDAHLDAPVSFVAGDAGTGSLAGLGTALSPYILTMTASTIGQGPSFLDLQNQLRRRLNDYDSQGNYSDDDIDYCLNIAYRETQMATKCYRKTTDVTLLADTHTYFTDDIFEPLEASIGTLVLKKSTMGDLGYSLQSWNETAASTPTKWLMLQGSYIRVYPTPAAGATLTVHGYGIAADMVNDTDYPSAIPIGYAASSILDRAEAEARKMRSTYANNSALYTALMQSWNSWLQLITGSIKS